MANHAAIIQPLTLCNNSGTPAKEYEASAWMMEEAGPATQSLATARAWE